MATATSEVKPQLRNDEVENWLSAVYTPSELWVRASVLVEEEDDIYQRVARWIENHRAILVERFEEEDAYMMAGQVIVSIYEATV